MKRKHEEEDEDEFDDYFREKHLQMCLDTALTYTKEKNVYGLTSFYGPAKDENKQLEGPGEVAKMYAILHQHKYSFRMSTRPYMNPTGEPWNSFGSCSTIEKFYDCFRRIPEHIRSFHEKLFGCPKLLADIEYYIPLRHEERPTTAHIRIIENESLNKLYLLIDQVVGKKILHMNGCFLSSRNSRAVTISGHENAFLKISLHVVHTGIYFTSIVEQMPFWLYLEEKAKTLQIAGFFHPKPIKNGLYKTEPQSMVDLSIYNKGANFRTAFSAKLGTSIGILLAPGQKALTLVNFVSLSYCRYELQDREKTWQESGLTRQDFDELIPPESDIVFFDSTVYQCGQTIPDHIPRILQNPIIPELQIEKTGLALPPDPGLLQQWINTALGNHENNNFVCRSLKKKEGDYDSNANTYYLYLKKKTGCSLPFRCNQGKNHYSNNACIYIKPCVDSLQYIALCQCYGCKKGTKWDAVPIAVVNHLNLPTLHPVLTIQQIEERDTLAMWRQKAITKLQEKYGQDNIVSEKQVGTYSILHKHQKSYTCVFGQEHSTLKKVNNKYKKHKVLLNKQGFLQEYCKCTPQKSILWCHATDAGNMDSKRRQMWLELGCDLHDMEFDQIWDDNSRTLRHRIKPFQLINPEGIPYKSIFVKGPMDGGKSYQCGKTLKYLSEQTEKKMETYLQWKKECALAYKEYRNSVEYKTLVQNIQSQCQEEIAHRKTVPFLSLSLEEKALYKQRVFGDMPFPLHDDWTQHPILRDFNYKHLPDMEIEIKHTLQKKYNLPDQDEAHLHENRYRIIQSVCRIQQGKSALALHRKTENELRQRFKTKKDMEIYNQKFFHTVQESEEFNQRNEITDDELKEFEKNVFQIYNRIVTDDNDDDKKVDESTNPKPYIDFLKYLKSDRLIIEMESLYKLNRIAGSNQRHVNIMDEIRSLCNCLFSFGTHKEHLQENVEFFKTLFTTSKLNLCLDADLECDEMVPELIKAIYPTMEERKLIRIERYPLNVDIQTRKKIVIETNENGWLTRIRDCIQRGERIGIFLRSRRFGRKMETFIKRWNHNQNNTPIVYKFYNSEEDDRIFDDFDNLDVAWRAPINLIMFTSSVTVGADSQTKIDSCFIQGHGRGGALARDAIQGIGRFRGLVGSIFVLLDELKYEKRQTLQEIREQIDRSAQLRQEGLWDVNDYAMHQSGLAFDNVAGNVRLVPSWYINLYAIHKQEKLESFTMGFLRLCVQKGYMITFQDYSQTEEKQLQRDNIATNLAIENEKEEDFYTALTWDDEKMWIKSERYNDAMVRIIRKEASSDDHLYVKFAILHSSYTTSKMAWDCSCEGKGKRQCHCLTMLKLYQNPKLNDQVLAQCRILNNTTANLKALDIDMMSSGNYRNVATRCQGVERELLDKIVQVLGFKSINDRNTQIPHTVLFNEKNQKELKALCTKAIAVSSKSIRTCESKKEWRIVKHYTTETLKMLNGLSLLTTTSPDKRKIYYNLVECSPYLTQCDNVVAAASLAPIDEE